MTLSYDRRAPKPLLDVLAKDGWAHSLVEYGRAGQYALDLQLRGYASGNHWATLYVGLTKAVDLHFLASRGFRLNAHGTYKTPARGWSPEWEKWHSGDKLASFWPQVEDYLERVIPSVGARYLKEGAVQSAISGFASQDLVVIDREAAITFSNQREKMAVTQRLLRPLLAAMVGTSDAAWWKSTPTSLGGECDALAVRLEPARATPVISGPDGSWYGARVTRSAYIKAFRLLGKMVPVKALHVSKKLVPSSKV